MKSDRHKTHRRRKTSVSRRWWIVRRFVRCLRGCGIVTGEPALFVRVGPERSVRCQACAKRDYDLEPPGPEPFAPSPDGLEDLKTRSTGG